MTRLPRAVGGERMDAPELDPRQLGVALDDLRRVNRWLGGRRGVILSVARLLPLLPRPTRLLDVGTGGADVAIALAAMARARGVEMEIVASDVHPQTLEEARRRTRTEPAVRVERADALDLPYADGEFDLVFCTTMLHHFDRDAAVRVLREMNRVAAGAVLVSDLRRSVPALIGAHLLAATAWRSHVLTRHDGPLSVRRAYTKGELAALARDAGLLNARVRREPVFRLSLVAGAALGGGGPGAERPAQKGDAAARDGR